MLNLEKHLTLSKEVILSPNLADRFEDVDLSRIGGLVWEGYDHDKTSRLGWEKRMQAAMDLAMQVQQAKNFPWPGASNVIFPLVTIASLQFSARSYASIIQGTNVVRYRTIGQADAAGVDRAKRIGKHMSWQVLEQDEAWEEQHDRLLINLAIVGSAFIKTYYDAGKRYPVGELVMSKDLVLDYYATSVEAAARKTHRFPLHRNEMIERMLRGTFVDYTEDPWFVKAPATQSGSQQTDRRLGKVPPASDSDTPFYMLEQHRWMDLDGDGYEEPYTVTIDETSKKVLRIVARWEREEDIERIGDKIARIKPTEYFTKYSFIPSPDGGVYDLGFGIFLGPINEAVNSGINQMLDFGTMQNSLGGLLGRGAKIRGGTYTMSPWEFKRVDSTGDDLRKNIYMWPDKAPPTFLFQLIELLIEYSNRIAGTVDATMGENPGQNTPASTFQGMTEQGLQIYKMIYKRVWRAMKAEFKVRYNINRVTLPSTENFGHGKDFIRREDYTGSPDQVAPVANPNVSSTVMKLSTAMTVKQSAMGTPGYDLAEVERQFLEVLEVDNVDQVYPGPGKVPPGHEAPNPKAAVEMLKLQGKQMDIKAKQQQWANELMAEQQLNQAKIKLLEAQAMKAAAEAQGAQAAAQIEAFEQLINAHKEYGDMLNKRVATMLGGGDGQSNDGEGVSNMEGKSGNSSDSGVSVNVPGGSEVSVGSGSAK